MLIIVWKFAFIHELQDISFHLSVDQSKPVRVDALGQKIYYQHEPPSNVVQDWVFLEAVNDLIVGDGNPVGIEVRVANRQSNVPLSDNPCQQVGNKNENGVDKANIIVLEIAREGKPSKIQENT